MEHLNKLLFHIESTPELFKQKDIGFILGLTNTQIKDLKKSAIENGFIVERQRQFYLTDLGKIYIQEHPFTPSGVNLEYLKFEKMPPILTKAIRCLARHLLENEELKEHSIETYLTQELLSGNSNCKNLREEIEKYILQGKKIKLTELFEEFVSKDYTKSVVAVLLLDVLAKNRDNLAIYEKLQFQLNLNQLMFDRMIFCPQNFEIQKTLMEELPILEEISLVLAEKPSKNILDITKALIHFIRDLDKYTLNTERLSKKTLRFRNVIMNAKDPISLFNRDIPKVLSGKMLVDCDEEFLNNYKTAIKELKKATSNMVEEINNFFFESFRSTSRKELTERFEAIEEFIGEKELKILINNVIEKEAEDTLWIERIATFINKSRVPKDWSDEDVADFKVKVKELAIKFLALESTSGKITIVFDDKLNNLFKQLVELTQAEKNILLRRVING